MAKEVLLNIHQQTEFRRTNGFGFSAFALEHFEEIWPTEFINFKKCLSQYPTLDLACGSTSDCFQTLKGLQTIIGSSNELFQYIGVDKFSINDSDSYLKRVKEEEIEYLKIKENMKMAWNKVDIPFFDKVSFVKSDLLDFLETRDNSAIIIIGGFAMDICCPKGTFLSAYRREWENWKNDYYRDYLINEIVRVLPTGGYCLASHSYLNDFNNIDLYQRDLSEVPINTTSELYQNSISSPYSRNLKGNEHLYKKL